MGGWSIHTRREITSKYEILERVGYGAYSDVYKGRRRSDSLAVALKEVHDYQSAFREIEALQALQNCPNIVILHEYFWDEDDDAVLVLEYLPTDLAAVIQAAKREWEGGISVGEVKRWMVQILKGLEACHLNSIVHRDLKPSNLLISADGILKIADFGQARIIFGPEFVAADGYDQPSSNQAACAHPAENLPILDGQSCREHREFCCGTRSPGQEELRADAFPKNIDKDHSAPDGSTSYYSTCTENDVKEDEAEERGEDGNGLLTSCVGTRWFRAPELLYGSTCYGREIDLWSIGCIFAELLILEPIFPGTSDLDQLARIFSILGNLTEEVWPGCVKLPDYEIISFTKVDKPIGLEACLQNRSPDEVSLIGKLLCFDPGNRASAMELLQHKYLNEEPLPVPLAQLRIPSKHGSEYDDSPVEQKYDYDSGSDFDDFCSSHITNTENGFSIRFS